MQTKIIADMEDKVFSLLYDEYQYYKKHSIKYKLRILLRNILWRLL